MRSVPAVMAVCTMAFLLSCASAPSQVDPALNAALLQQAEQRAAAFERWASELGADDYLRTTVQLGHAAAIRSIEFSPDGRFLLTSSDDSTAKLWEIASGREVRMFSGHAFGIYSAAFSPDGKLVVTGSVDETVKIWDVATGLEIHTLEGHAGYVGSVVFSPDGHYVLSGSDDQTAKLWSVATGTHLRTFSGHSDRVGSVAFSPNGRLVLTGSADGTAKLWNVETGVQVHAVRMTPSPHQHTVAVAFSPDGRSVLTGSDGRAMLWNPETGSVVREFQGVGFDEWAAGTTVAFSSDGRRILVGAAKGMPTLFDVATGRELGVLFTYALDTVYSMGLSPDGLVAAVSSQNDPLSLVQLDRGVARALVGRPEAITSVAFSPDGEYVMTGSWDGSAHLRRVSTGRQVATFSGHNGAVSAVAFSHDGRYALSGSRDNSVKLWNLSTEEVIWTYTGHSQQITAVAFSANGNQVLTSSADRTTRLLNAGTGAEIRVLAGLEWPIRAFSPDGERALIGNYNWTGTSKVWDLTANRELRTITGHQFPVISASFSRDGRHVLTGSWEPVARVWDVETGEEVRTFPGHSGAVTSAAFSPDGEFVMTGSGTLHYWNNVTGEEIYSAISTPSGESLVWTTDGYFSGDAAFARETVHIVRGLEVISIDQFFDQFYRPDIVEARIAGYELPQESEPVGTVAQAVASLPPVVRLELQHSDGSFAGLTPLGMRAGSGAAATAAAAASAAVAQLPGGRTPQVAAADLLVSDGRVEVRVIAEERSGGGAQEIRLFHNGVRVSGSTRGLVPVGRESGGAGRVEQVFTVQLADGENTLRAVAFSNTRVESAPVMAVLEYEAPRQVEPTLWVLAVGIDEYRNSSYNLNYAVGDAQGFTQAVRRSGQRLFTDIRETLLTDSQATGADITAALERIAEESQPEDVFMFFYAGHGIALTVDGASRPEFFFVPPDVTQMTDPGQVQRLGISGVQFEELVSAIPARKQLHVLDACNAGAITAAFGIRGAAEEIALSRLSRATGSALIAASRDDQFAQEFTALGQGALTRALLDGLGGAAAGDDGQITVGLLKSYVERQLPVLTRQHAGREQYPTGFIFGQDFPVGVRR